MNLLKLDGFDDALIGKAFNQKHECYAYDVEKIIEILTRDMSRDEALEYFEFNVAGAWAGVSTPVFIDREDDL
jgi:tagatose-1,6-bisphosphate aldolase